MAVTLGCDASAAPDGTLRVIDADTFDVGDVRVRLFGVDAPEIGQPCTAHGQTWDCGVWARDIVRDRFEGRHARCRQVDIDRYDRVVATCEIGGVDLGAALVSDGVAWAYRRYSSQYDLDEKAAAIEGRGLWAVDIQLPQEYRAGQVASRDAPDADCAIKGNISKGGQIYHMPGGRDYDRTGINPARGERWFCSAAEARAAGWRAARN